MSWLDDAMPNDARARVVPTRAELQLRHEGEGGQRERGEGGDVGTATHRPLRQAGEWARVGAAAAEEEEEEGEW